MFCSVCDATTNKISYDFCFWLNGAILPSQRRLNFILFLLLVTVVDDDRVIARVVVAVVVVAVVAQMLWYPK